MRQRCRRSGPPDGPSYDLFSLPLLLFPQPREWNNTGPAGLAPADRGECRRPDAFDPAYMPLIAFVIDEIATAKAVPISGMIAEPLAPLRLIEEVVIHHALLFAVRDGRVLVARMIGMRMDWRDQNQPDDEHHGELRDGRSDDDECCSHCRSPFLKLRTWQIAKRPALARGNKFQPL